MHADLVVLAYIFFLLNHPNAVSSYAHVSEKQSYYLSEQASPFLIHICVRELLQVVYKYIYISHYGLLKKKKRKIT